MESLQCPKPRVDRIADIAAELDITSSATPPWRAIGGQRQRVYWGELAILPKPKALLLDEPLSAVDLGQRQSSCALVCAAFVS